MNGDRLSVEIGSWFVFLILAAIAAGCGAPQPEVAAPTLGFEAHMEVNSDQELRVSLGIENAGSSTFAGDERLDGEMELRRASGEQAGALRARAEVKAVSSLEPGETAWPMSWRGRLEPGAYTLTWGAERYGATRIQFEIVDRGGRLALGAWQQAQAEQP